MQKKIGPKDRAVRTGVLYLQGGIEVSITETGTEEAYNNLKSKWVAFYNRFIVDVVDAEPVAAPAKEEE